MNTNKFFVMADSKVRVCDIHNVRLIQSCDDMVPYIQIMGHKYYGAWKNGEALYAINALRDCGFYTISEHWAATLRMNRYIREYKNRKKEAA